MKRENIFPILLLAALMGCASAPAPRSAPPGRSATVSEKSSGRNWNGEGGSASIRNRGEALADFALRLQGTPYRYGGATLDGFDCSGLVFYAHRQLGLVVPRTSRDQADQASSIKANKLERGDLVFFKIGSRSVNHVGIYIGARQFVHAPGAGKPVTVSSLDDEFYSARFSLAGRFWNRLPR